jgi:hypothetical protein
MTIVNITIKNTGVMNYRGFDYEKKEWYTYKGDLVKGFMCKLSTNEKIQVDSYERLKELINDRVDHPQYYDKSFDNYRKAIEEFYEDENKNKYLYNE